jgi:periplasmic divalent cation tolerance protein
MKLSLYLLSCANIKEAQNIRRALLEKKLIVCGKINIVDTQNLWQGKIENGKEALLQMESRSSFYNKIFIEVKKLHSYNTFVLLQIPVTHTSKDVNSWLTSELSEKI